MAAHSHFEHPYRSGRGAAATVLWMILALPGTASAGVLTLQDMFNGASFTQDGLAFSNFDPVLSNSLPSGQDVSLLLSTNPLGLFNASFLDFQSGQFSESWGNAQDADAGNIGLDVLPDDGSTTGVDPGFRLNSASEWTVDAGWSTPGDSGDDIASAQLSAFAYTVTATTPQLINSAGIHQVSTVDAVGPDVFSLNLDPFELEFPDAAAGFALQYVIDSNSNTLAQNLTLEGAVRTSSTMVLPLSQLEIWSSFADQDAIRVINVIGIGATSESGFTMSALEQRIDPPPPGGVPIPGTLLLVGIGLALIRYQRGGVAV